MLWLPKISGLSIILVCDVIYVSDTTHFLASSKWDHTGNRKLVVTHDPVFKCDTKYRTGCNTGLCV